MVGGVIFCTGSQPIRRVFGKVFRALAYAPLYMLGFSAAIWLLSLISKIVSDHSSMLYLTAAFASTVLAVIVEVNGGHHSSAEPTEPAAPSP